MAATGGPTGAMVSLRCDEATALELIPRVDGYITVANLNSPRQTVLSGESMAVQTVERLAQENGIGARILPVAGAFHSRLCETAARQVEEMELLRRSMDATVCPIVSSTDGGAVAAGISSQLALFPPDSFASRFYATGQKYGRPLRFDA